MGNGLFTGEDLEDEDNEDSCYSTKFIHDQKLIHRYLVEAKLDFEKKWLHIQTETAELNDFGIIRTIGKGCFSQVMLVNHKGTGHFYAMKIMDKIEIVHSKQIDHVFNEKHILSAINFPFTINLSYHFKDNSYIYLVMEYISGGDLFTHLTKSGRFTEHCCKFYASQVALSFEYLQSLGLIYRDLKPENLLIAYDGYLKMTDFGFAKKVEDRTWTLCGTKEYLAPEIILRTGYTKAVDWWAFGVLIYEMAAGQPPFCAKQPIEIYKKILVGEVTYPPYFSSDIIHLIKHLLTADLSKRYGTLQNGIRDIKTHSWFESIHWLEILEKRVAPPYIPAVIGPGFTQNFVRFTEEPHIISDTDMYEKEFDNF